MKWCNLLYCVLATFIVIVGILITVKNIDKYNASISTYNITLSDSSLYNNKAVNKILIAK